MKFLRKLLWRLFTIVNVIAWWDWEEKVIKERIIDCYNSTDQFITKYYLCE